MTRARTVVAATLVGASLAAGTALAQAPQTTTAPLTPILAGKKITPPLRGTADIELTTPVTKRDKDNVVTKIQVKNISNAPIARLTVDETWYDGVGATGNVVAGGKGMLSTLLQPGEVQTITIETPFNPKMKANQWNFSHANGSVKPHRVAKLEPGTSTTSTTTTKEPAAKTASKKK